MGQDDGKLEVEEAVNSTEEWSQISRKERIHKSCVWQSEESHEIFKLKLSKVSYRHLLPHLGIRPILHVTSATQENTQEATHSVEVTVTPVGGYRRTVIVVYESKFLGMPAE